MGIMSNFGRTGDPAGAFLRGFLKTRLGQLEAKSEKEALDEQRAYEKQVLEEERAYEAGLRIDEREWAKELIELQTMANIAEETSKYNLKQQNLDAEELQAIDDRKEELMNMFNVPEPIADKIESMGWLNTKENYDTFLYDEANGLVSNYGLNWADPSTVNKEGIPIINFFDPSVQKGAVFDTTSAVNATKNNISSAGSSTIDVLTSTAGSEAAKTGEIMGQYNKTVPETPYPIPPVEPKEPDYNQINKSIFDQYKGAEGFQFDPISGDITVMDPDKRIELDAVSSLTYKYYYSGDFGEDPNLAAKEAKLQIKTVDSLVNNLDQFYNTDVTTTTNLKIGDRVMDMSKPNYIYDIYSSLQQRYSSDTDTLLYFLNKLSKSNYITSLSGNDRKQADSIIELLKATSLGLNLGFNK